MLGAVCTVNSVWFGNVNVLEVVELPWGSLW